MKIREGRKKNFFSRIVQKGETLGASLPFEALRVWKTNRISAADILQE